MGFSTAEDRADEIREQLADLRRAYEEECQELWSYKYENDAIELRRQLNDVLGII